MVLLSYERDLIREIAHQSCLTVLANGLGAHEVVIEMCKLFAEANLFVIVLNTSTAEQQYMFDKLKLRSSPSSSTAIEDGAQAKKARLGSASNDALINSRIRYISYQFGTSADRRQVYQTGGVFFMSTAPLVILDLLNGVMPANLVSGVLVPSAHQLVTSQDSNDSAPISLAIRLLVEQNPGVFVTAISDRPGAITADVGAGLSRLAAGLLVDRVLLRPRYEASVKRSFKAAGSSTDDEATSLRITQIDVNLTPSQTTCHSALLQLCSLCSRELRSALGSVSCLQRSDTIGNANLANSQLPTFNSTRKASMETELEAIRLAKDVGRGGAWSLLPAKARNLAEDVTVLRSLVASLLRDNPFNFYNKVMSITNDPHRRVSAGSSGWIAHAETILLEKAAKERAGLSARQSGDGDAASEVQTGPEVLPLWESLESVFEEVRLCSEDADNLYAVVGYDDAHVAQLSAVLKHGAKNYLEMEKQRYLERQQQQQQQNAGGKFGAKNKFPKRKPRMNKAENDDADLPEEDASSQREIVWIRMKDSHLGRLEELNKFFSTDGPFGCRKNRIIILCTNSLTLMRQIEKLCAQAEYSQAGTSIHVYWLSHRGTLEERDYLAGLAAEAASFARLANDRAALAVSRDLLLSNARAVREEREDGGGGNKVLVDVRELRSQLPGAIHLRGLTIVPKTLLIADYILTPDCGIERKALPDLVSSIFSGRLYTQCSALTTAFTKPVLLIELPSSSISSFSSSSSSWNVVLPRHTALAEIRSSLILLVLRFPRLRIVWSPSPDASAMLFVQLKRSQPDPVIDASNVSSTEDDDDSGNLLRTLEHLPAITSRQARCLTNSINSLHELAVKCKSGALAQADGQIAAAIGAPAAKQLADFLNTDLSAAAIASQSSTAPTASASS